MRNATARTAVLQGIDAELTQVRARSEPGEGLDILGGLAAARDQLLATLRTCGHELPPDQRIVLETPRHAGPGNQLAAVVATLLVLGVLPKRAMARVVFWGEVTLAGEVRPICGAVSVADQARAAGYRLVVARASEASVSVMRDLDVVAISSLAELRDALRHGSVRQVVPPTVSPTRRGPEFTAPGFGRAKRAIEVALAGQHPLILRGPPSAERDLLLRWIGTLLPDLDDDAQLEVAKVHDTTHCTPSAHPLRPPLRMPHATVSALAMFGGGTPIRPGEVTLAHRGALVLDEAPEYGFAILDGLAEILRSGEVQLPRATGVVRLPARFLLVLAVNPCPCGWFGQARCRCEAESIDRYQSRLAKLRRRIALDVESDATDTSVVLDLSTAAIRRRVELADERRAERAGEMRPFTRAARRMLDGLPEHVTDVAATLADLDPRCGVWRAVGERHVLGARVLSPSAASRGRTAGPD